MFQKNSLARLEDRPTSSGRHVLLIEDNPADSTLAKIIHDETGHCSWLDVVSNGEEAIRYLRRHDDCDESKPDIILLDMSLPMITGLEMIKVIRELPGYELVPIVMVSGSDNPISLQQAYELGANCVIRKSSSFDEYFKKLESCYRFWCSIVELPPSNGNRQGSTELHV